MKTYQNWDLAEQRAVQQYEKAKNQEYIKAVIKPGMWCTVGCGWGDTRAKLQYTDQDTYYWISNKGFKFLTHDLKDVHSIEM